MWILIGTALGWSHRGHLWEAEAFPLEVCPDTATREATARAVALWKETSGISWFQLSCDDPDVWIALGPDESGAMSRFVLHTDESRTDRCDYEAIRSGAVQIRFDERLPWEDTVATVLGECDGEELQTRLLVRYLGITLGLDSSADGAAMAAFDDCGTAGVSRDDHAGLRALYAPPRQCEAPSTPAPREETEPVGCSATTPPATSVWSWLSRR